MSNSIASRKRTMQSLHLDLAKQKRFCKTEIRSRKSNSAENIWSFRILIDLILWQILVRSEKLESALFASMHARRIRCIIFFIDFLIISHLFHFIDTFSESSTVKSHKYWVNEIAMWNEKFETFVKSLNHNTNRQRVAIAFSSSRLYSDEKYLLHNVFFRQF